MTRVGLVRGAGAAAAVLLLLAGCGRPPTEPTPPGGSASASPAGSTSTQSGSPTGPATPDEDASFGFDDVASYQSGVEVEIAGTQARRATPGVTGAESARGEIVVVSVLLRNLSSVDLDASRVLVTTAYGRDDREATLVTDPTGTLTGGFLGSLTPGAEDTADLGFAVPFAALGEVRITVDLGDDVHAPVTFAGAVERDQ